MGLIHSRAAKKRNRAEAKLLKEQARELKEDRAADATAIRQPTVGLLIGRLIRDHRLLAGGPRAAYGWRMTYAPLPVLYRTKPASTRIFTARPAVPRLTPYSWTRDGSEGTRPVSSPLDLPAQHRGQLLIQRHGRLTIEIFTGHQDQP